MAVETAETIETLRAARQQMSGSVGLVPTMGALHEGHLALVQQARSENDHVIATIFVNPTQFNDAADFAAYPHDLAHDLELFERGGVDLVFAPMPDVMYPSGYQTYVTVEQMTQPLEGAHRPGHFRGVTTVVAKLFNLTQPHRAYFGQKDAQQVAVIQRMVDDMNFPLAVVVCPTVREPDGLAMSSRNRNLTRAQRQAAPVLYQALMAAQAAYQRGERSSKILRRLMRDVLAQEPLADVDYVSVADARSLEELTQLTDQPVLVSLAVRIGQTRLIDNVLLPAQSYA
ncbi:MAG: pantoate--beta-alanine ligase [Anaerolineaceae bacterium]|nr:pantoate--beta-alanine ligase [Anaerolineaceae bacterium]